MKNFLSHHEMEPRQLFPGISATLAHSDNITISRVELEAGAPLPEHSHPHEQWTHVISGELELTVGDETRRMVAGMTAWIPSNVSHQGKAISHCLVLDIFNPSRTDLK